MDNNTPIVVKIHDVNIDKDYINWIEELKSRYRSAQIKAAVKVNVEGTEMPANVDAVTSASVVPEAYRQTVKPNGFTREGNKVRVLFVVGDPRHESVEWDLVNTAMKHFMDKGCEVELRDLYAIGWNPVITRDTFFQAKDGFGKTPKDVAVEQHQFLHDCDTPNAMVKGYMERVFQKQFAYRDTDKGLEGLMKGKAFYTIMNCGWIGRGRGGLGDGIDKNTCPCLPPLSQHRKSFSQKGRRI